MVMYFLAFLRRSLLQCTNIWYVMKIFKLYLQFKLSLYNLF